MPLVIMLFGRKDIPLRTIGVETPITNSAGLCNTDCVWRSAEHCQQLFVGHVNSNWLNLLAVGGVVTRSLLRGAGIPYIHWPDLHICVRLVGQNWSNSPSWLGTALLEGQSGCGGGRMQLWFSSSMLNISNELSLQCSTEGGARGKCGYGKWEFQVRYTSVRTVQKFVKR